MMKFEEEFIKLLDRELITEGSVPLDFNLLERMKTLQQNALIAEIKTIMQGIARDFGAEVVSFSEEEDLTEYDSGTAIICNVHGIESIDTLLDMDDKLIEIMVSDEKWLYLKNVPRFESLGY